ncbi:DNA-binding transcriptional regulator, CsgD family [Bradyrhizobium lablabi]|uniref:DNA-binding transcriptional regulator, CsgD family n=1 Tax=Bradyrhizobium lablabi TaxID=722472 RepID=A0A1M6XRL9_9BRAD|nr:helix-turn-helix transcriptional regulator [Bradyrhizobium lablabi]SHL08465.1 DNA-binding transcriptional regulator, CsgD family [Bradyrhizobium lablabi]
MPNWNLEAVEQGFAEAALDPTLWVKALDTATAITGSQGAVLIPTAGGSLPTLPFTERIAGSFEAYMRDGWHLRDERFRGIGMMMQRGVVDDLDLFDFDAIAKHPYYQEFLAPHGLRWFGGVRVSCGDELWCLSIQRTIDQGPFSAAEKEQLAQLSKRLSASAAIARALGASAAAGALDAFEISGTAVVLINRFGKVFQANQSAERLLVGEIEIKRGRLVVQDAQAQVALNAAIVDLLGRRTGGLSAPVALSRRGRRPLLAYPAKLTGATANALADCQAMIVLIDPDAGPKPPEATLRSVFRLSEAEARLGAQLALGESLETASEGLGIAKETSRSQLKSIFVKTGVRRQAELVAMLARLLNGGREERMP